MIFFAPKGEKSGQIGSWRGLLWKFAVVLGKKDLYLGFHFSALGFFSLTSPIFRPIHPLYTPVNSYFSSIVVLAQMVECALSMREARGSIPLDYTFFFFFRGRIGRKVDFSLVRALQKGSFGEGFGFLGLFVPFHPFHLFQPAQLGLYRLRNSLDSIHTELSSIGRADDCSLLGCSPNRKSVIIRSGVRFS